MSLVVGLTGGIGRGKSAVGPGGERESGWNYGAGVRVGLSRLGRFAEMRRHDPLKRTIMTLGITF